MRGASSYTENYIPYVDGDAVIVNFFDFSSPFIYS